MAVLKILLCLTLFVAVVLANVVSDTRRDHNIDFCQSAGEGKKWTLYYTTSINIPGKILQIIEHDIYWPISGESSGKIKCLKIIDCSPDGTGGYPSLREGGIEFDYVTIHLESERSHGLCYHIEIFGEPAIPA